MAKLTWLALAGALIAWSSGAGAAPESVTALADRYVAIQVENTPYLADMSGVPGPEDRLPDLSPAALARYNAAEDALQAEVSAIDAGQVAPADRPTYAILKEALASDIGLRVCRRELWSVDHVNGWQATLPDVAALQPVGSPAARMDALKRWSALPRYLEQDQANLQAGLKQGFSSPKSVVRRVIAQLDGLLATDPEHSPFASPGIRDGDPATRAAFIKLVSDVINPALRAYRNYLSAYLPQARDALAVSALPDGRACYAASLRQYTTLTRPPEAVYALGEATVARNDATVVALGMKLYGSSDVATIIARNRAAPDNHFTSPDDLLADSKSLLARAQSMAKPLFVKLPGQPVIIEPVPAYQENSGVDAHYDIQPDLAKPGKYILPLDAWRSMTRGSAEVTVFHETIPGHHLQLSLALEHPYPSLISKLVVNSAYAEGWARYAEALSEEAGLYATDLAKIERRAWPAHGMVVDPGLHVLGWSNQRALDYVKATGRFDDQTGPALLDRIAMMPGQLTAYDTGGLEIMALRKEAKDKLGDRFSLPAFHQAVLEEGNVPLGELDAHVRQWIKAQAGG